MLDLEKQISDWRKQMLAAGIKTPAPLDELEIHLREEIERQMKSGLNEQKAFEIAIQKIGQGNLLKNEFKKINCGAPFVIHHALGILWMILCIMPSAFYLWFLLQVRHSIPAVTFDLDFDLAILFCLLALAGGMAGFSLFRNALWTRTFFNLITIVGILASISWIIAFASLPMFIGAFDFLLLTSVILLQVERRLTART
jgi:hypothetical protein